MGSHGPPGNLDRGILSCMAEQLPPPPPEPDVDLWLDGERLARLDTCLAAPADFLAQAGLLSRAIEYWIRQEIAAEAPAPTPPQLEELSRHQEQWLKTHDLVAMGLRPEQVSAKLAVTPAGRRWARQQWGHRLESLFLARKADLDQASCRLLRVSSKPLCLELYHRIKAGEATFAEVAGRYGEGPEAAQGGVVPLQPLSRLPMGLGPVLERMRPGDILPPQRLAKGFAVVQLERFDPARFDARSEELLLALELSAWVAAAMPRVLAHLRSDVATAPSPP